MHKFKVHIKRNLPLILIAFLLFLPSCRFLKQKLRLGEYSLKKAIEWAKADSTRIADSLKRIMPDEKVFERIPTDSMKRVLSEKKVFEKTLTDSLMSLEAAYLPEGETDSRFYIIIGSYSNRANAEVAANKFSSQGFKTAILPKPGNNTNNLLMVSVKTFTDRDKASLFLKEFKGKYDPNAWIFERK